MKIKLPEARQRLEALYPGVSFTVFVLAFLELKIDVSSKTVSEEDLQRVAEYLRDETVLLDLIRRTQR